MKLRARLARLISRIAVCRGGCRQRVDRCACTWLPPLPDEFPDDRPGGRMSERPLSRQPSCPTCDHEHHEFTRCHADLGETGALCPCPPRAPTGIYLP